MMTKRLIMTAIIFGCLWVFGLHGAGVLEKAGGLFHLTPLAEANEHDQLIRTYLIDPTTFVIEADALVMVTVSAHATLYQLQSDGKVRFTTPADGRALAFNLEEGDQVIERPDSGYVTVVR